MTLTCADINDNSFELSVTSGKTLDFTVPRDGHYVLKLKKALDGTPITGLILQLKQSG